MSESSPIEKLRNAIVEREQKVLSEVKRIANGDKRSVDEFDWFVEHSYKEVDSIKRALEELRASQNLEIDNLQALSSRVREKIEALKVQHNK
jgi:ferritin